MIASNIRRAPSLARSAFLAAATVAVLAAPTRSASAQLGGLVKRATSKVVEKQVDKKVDKQVEKHAGGDTSTPEGTPPTFDEVILELNTERVDQVLRGLAASRALLDGTKGGASHASLVAKRDAEANRSAQLREVNSKVIDAFNEKDRDIGRCRYDAISASQKKHQEANTARAQTDPAFREKMMQVAQRYAMAQATGDSATMRKAQDELFATAKEDAKADTLAADKACGPEPTPPAVIAQIAEVNARLEKFNQQIRKLEEHAAAAEVKESGMNERQFAMSKERIEMYLADVESNSRPKGFTAAEVTALGARRADLSKAIAR